MSVTYSDNLMLFLFQIKHMVAFIEQEANEKAEEIDAKVISYYFFTFLASYLAFRIIWSLSSMVVNLFTF